MSSVLVERISGIKIVQAFTREKTEMKRYTKQADQYLYLSCINPNAPSLQIEIKTAIQI
ncbi:ABC transporter transmembrane domain-containing protein [Halalkalibacter kiskunsagensis]